MIESTPMIAARGIYKALKAGSLRMEGSQRFVKGDDLSVKTKQDFDYYTKLDSGVYMGDLDAQDGRTAETYTGTVERCNQGRVQQYGTRSDVTVAIQGTSESGVFAKVKTYNVGGNIESITQSFRSLDQDKIRVGSVRVDEYGKICVDYSEAAPGDTGYISREWVLLPETAT